ncbi:hypothetical protein RFI_36865 [Reticulomyxa filosa]|uniref:Uncharacterized protein n=1 Tax=Reticulomyxa filosa TaxID=46433 RepID=X6LEZ9_RETFI|nr:hypothetical protein RFI_36865 [Reticulomyxa filosa]|eukprot:ETO00573.1 hypothetical protein RFI_36865 [Reticulomyxa filosa]
MNDLEDFWLDKFKKLGLHVKCCSRSKKKKKKIPVIVCFNQIDKLTDEALRRIQNVFAEKHASDGNYFIVKYASKLMCAIIWSIKKKKKMHHLSVLQKKKKKKKK